MHKKYFVGKNEAIRRLPITPCRLSSATKCSCPPHPSNKCSCNAMCCIVQRRLLHRLKSPALPAGPTPRVGHEAPQAHRRMARRRLPHMNKLQARSPLVRHSTMASPRHRRRKSIESRCNGSAMGAPLECSWSANRAPWEGAPLQRHWRAMGTQ